jgi:uncharacterized membrane protein
MVVGESRWKREVSDVTSTKANIGRRLIAAMPLLLVLGIVAQAIMLVAVIVLYVPCLLFPGILNGPYRWITRGMARIMARSFVGGKREVSRI